MNNNENDTKSKKTIIIWSCIILLLLCVIGVVIYLVVHSNNANGQIRDFKTAVKDKDYNKIAEYLWFCCKVKNIANH
ncbi:hypothetical protein ACWEVK_13225 [Staphylococcus xylosus]